MKFLLAAFLLVVSSSSLFAAGGTIVGKVTGKDETEPLVGVNVFVQGSVRGAATNAEGKYRIADVAPGTYTLVFSLVGYQREVRTNVLVREGIETVVNVAMTVSPVQAEQVVVTANKRPQSLQDVPVSVAVMDAVEMQSRNPQTIEDAMRYIPGVNITGGQVNIRGSSGYTKGAGSRIILLLDGIPFIAGDTGELIFEQIPVGQIDRIEVVKGASSALYGSSALGGVINVITKPIPENPETFVRTYGGLYSDPSYERWRWTDKDLGFGGLSIGQSVKFGDLGVVAAFSRQVNDSYQANDFTRRYNIYLKARQDFSSENSLTMNFGYLSQYRGLHNWWRNIDSALLTPYVQRDDNVKSTRQYLSGLYTDALSDNVLLTVKGLWNNNDWFSTSVHDDSAKNWKRTPSGRFAETLESFANDYRIEAGATAIIDNDHTVTGGITGQFFAVRSDSALFGKHSGWTSALYAQDEWRINEDWTFTFGARVDMQRTGIGDTRPQFNPKLAGTYKADETTTLRASFGRGFRVPSVAEVFVGLELGGGINTVPNADLKPERSYAYEVGLAKHLGDIGTVDVAAFWTDYDNLIEPTPFQDQFGNYKIQWQNTPKARVQGFEASWKVGFFDGDLLWNFGYTYAYAHDLTPRVFAGLDSVVNARPNNVLPYRPKHVLTTSVQGRVNVLRAGVDFRYLSKVDRVFDLFVNTKDFFIPNADARVAIIVTDFRFGADFTSVGVPLSVMLNVNNAFHYNYLELTANMAPPRTIMLVLEAKL